MVKTENHRITLQETIKIYTLQCDNKKCGVNLQNNPKANQTQCTGC